MVQLPENFVNETRRVMGPERFSRFLSAFDEEPPVSIRLNTRRFGKQPSIQVAASSTVPWCADGYYLEGRPAFTFDPLLHAGCYYVQEASSMFITHILQHALPADADCKQALDMCAAPGGKSTAMRNVLPPQCTLVSNEPMGTRAQILLENITKWGAPHCIVTNNYPRDFRKSKLQFDVILCDVPCSGEGMFRKDPGAITAWSEQNVEKCAQLQREIVTDAWACLNPGGLMIYSTCTYNTRENEENIQWLLQQFDAEPISIPIQDSWGITGSLLPGFTAPVYRFIPGFTRGEGLFVCALRKGGKTLQKKSVLDARALKALTVLQPPFDSTAELPLANVDYPTALRYLRGEVLQLPADTPRGLITITYQRQPLGQVKNIGSRANNLYPKPWRIKSTHLPNKAPECIVLSD